MPVTNCLVDGCKSVGIVFRAPRNAFLKQIWRMLLSPHCSTLKDKSNASFVNCKVCKLHFEQKYLHEFNKNRRILFAYPTLFTLDEIASGVSALGEFLTSTLDKFNKINEDQGECDKAKHYVDHTYSIRHRLFYQSDTDLLAQLSEYIDTQYGGATNKVSEGQESSNPTSNDFISENEDRSRIISKRREVQAYRRSKADKSNFDSSSKYFNTEKHDGSQISSKKIEDQSFGRNSTDRNNSNSNSHERISATLPIVPHANSFNLNSTNVIDVIRHGPDEPDVTAPEEETCITDDTQYRFDGYHFDDGLPTIQEPEPDVPEVIFSWQKELDLFPLDDAGELQRGAAAPEELAADASLYDPGAPEGPLDSEYQCNECQKEITGFRYTCVQCADWDLCGACEAREEHAAHYLLRIPSPRPYKEIQTVLAAIRQQLFSESLFLHPEFTDDWPAQVKEEGERGEGSAGEHSCAEVSSEESEGSASPRRKRARPAPPAPHTQHIHLTDDILQHISPENNEIFSPELSFETLPASVQPVASTPTEIPKDVTEFLTFLNPPKSPYGTFKSLARGKTLGGISLLKPIHTLERPPKDPLRIDTIEGLANNSPKGEAVNLTNQQTKKSPPDQPCYNNVPIIIEDDAVQKSQPNQAPTLPLHTLGTNARPVGLRRITRSQFFDKVFDENVPSIILEDDEDDQPTEMVSRNSFLQPNEQLANSPTRMDIDSTPTDQRITRSKRKCENVTVHDPVRKSTKDIQMGESLLRTIGGAIETIDQLIHGNDILDTTEAVPDTSPLTGGSETVVLRVPPGSNEADLKKALQCKAIVLLQPLQYVIQTITPPRKRLK